MKTPSVINPTSVLLLLMALGVGCGKQPDQWQFDRQIALPEDSRPLALVRVDSHLWISDPQNYRLLQTDLKGRILDSITNLKRPMNIDADKEGSIYIPEYHTDTIWQLENGNLKHVPVNANLRAPAGISVQNGTMAIADFYNHRIVVQKGDEVKNIGSKGHDSGKLYYPIDVKIFRDKIYVADAYNHRVQVFGKEGALLRVIGAKDSLKVASGIHVNQDQIAVTDQEHDRVMIYDHQGKVLQRLNEHIHYPTDVFLKGNVLYIANFKDHKVTVYEKK